MSFLLLFSFVLGNHQLIKFLLFLNHAPRQSQKILLPGVNYSVVDVSAAECHGRSLFRTCHNDRCSRKSLINSDFLSWAFINVEFPQIRLNVPQAHRKRGRQEKWFFCRSCQLHTSSGGFFAKDKWSFSDSEGGNICVYTKAPPRSSCAFSDGYTRSSRRRNQCGILWCIQTTEQVVLCHHRMVVRVPCTSRSKTERLFHTN